MRPKRIRDSASTPSACQNVSAGQPNSAGNSQFQSSFTTSPPMTINATIPTSASGANKYQCFLIASSPQFVVDVLQPRAQVAYGVALARQEGVDVHAALARDRLEA